MYSDKELEQLFNRDITDFDVASPDVGHKERFMAKLHKEKKDKSKKKRGLYYIAASVILLIGFGLVYSGVINTEEIKNTQAEVVLPKEVINATFHFEGLVKKELERIELERNQETNEIIEEAFKQIKVLEEEQQRLQEQLKSHYDKRLVKGLIDNFQYRIQLLDNVMQQIEIIKEINSEHNETI